MWPLTKFLILTIYVFAGEIVPDQSTSYSDGSGTPRNPRYCDQKSESTSPFCQNKRDLVDFSDASEFIRQCPQNCSSLDVVRREEWGATNKVGTCDSKQTSIYKEIDKLKIARGKVECEIRKEKCKPCDDPSAANCGGSQANSQCRKWFQARAEIQKRLQEKVEPSCIPKMENPLGITIHHTTDEGFGRVENITPKRIQDAHFDRGWSDIGYHFLISIDSNGTWQVHEGRKRLDKCTFHQGGHGGPGLNSDIFLKDGRQVSGGTIGIAIAGNYEGNDNSTQPSYLGPGGSPQIPKEALAKLVQLMASLKRDCPSIQNVYGHSDLQKKFYGCVSTQCPGSGCRKILSDLEDLIK